jgi:hypothetical protein
LGKLILSKDPRYKICIGGGDKMATQMMVRIDPEVKSRFNKLARVEGKTSSEREREWRRD